MLNINEMQSKIERVNKLLRYLVCKEKLPLDSIQKVIAKKVNANKVSVSRALSGNEEYLTDAFIERLNNAFENEFNLDWLLRGEGDMIVKTGDVNVDNSHGMAVNTGLISGDGNNTVHRISEETIKNASIGYQDIIKTYQEHSDKMLTVIDRLIEKYGK